MLNRLVGAARCTHGLRQLLLNHQLLEDMDSEYKAEDPNVGQLFVDFAPFFKM